MMGGLVSSSVASTGSALAVISTSCPFEGVPSSSNVSSFMMLSNYVWTGHDTRKFHEHRRTNESRTARNTSCHRTGGELNGNTLEVAVTPTEVSGILRRFAVTPNEVSVLVGRNDASWPLVIGGTSIAPRSTVHDQPVASETTATSPQAGTFHVENSA